MTAVANRTYPNLIDSRACVAAKCESIWAFSRRRARQLDLCA